MKIGLGLSLVFTKRIKLILGLSFGLSLLQANYLLHLMLFVRRVAFDASALLKAMYDACGSRTLFFSGKAKGFCPFQSISNINHVLLVVSMIPWVSLLIHSLYYWEGSIIMCIKLQQVWFP